MIPVSYAIHAELFTNLKKQRKKCLKNLHVSTIIIYIFALLKKKIGNSLKVNFTCLNKTLLAGKFQAFGLNEPPWNYFSSLTSDTHHRKLVIHKFIIN